MGASAAVYTVIFPANLPLLGDFIRSVNDQSMKDFELIVANDGVQDPARYLCDLQVPYTVVPASGTPASIRQQGMAFLQRSQYAYFIFADSDDALGPNRVEESVKLLQRYPMMCNDLDLMTWEGEVFERGYWSARLSNEAEINQFFLIDKNIVGLGNTALRKEVLRDVPIPADLVAVDWFLFFRLLGKQKVVFSNACKSLYRQHQNNTIGLKAVTADRIHSVVLAKKLHYAALLQSGFAMKDQFQSVVSLEAKLKDEVFLNECITLLNSKSINYFWWEETNYVV